MYLGNSKIKGVFIKTYVPSNYPKKLEQEEIDQLIQDLNAPALAQTARKRLFEGHIRIVMQITGRYVSKLRNRTLEEELVDEAGLALVEAINNSLTKLKNNNITAYIISWVHMKLSHFIRQEYRLRDQKVINTVGKKSYTSANNLSVELNDFVKTNLTIIEKQVLELKLEGYSDTEIAAQLSVSRQYICRISNRIKNKFKRFL